jgi:hypothetical protein
LGPLVARAAQAFHLELREGVTRGRVGPTRKRNSRDTIRAASASC